MKKFIVLAAFLIAGMVGYSFAFPPTPPGGDMFKSVYDPNNDGIIAPAQGGTGAGTLTDGGILLGSGTGAITALGVATNGQIPIGDGTTDPVLATISGTANEVDVTNGAGTITIGIVNPLAASKGGTGADTSALTGLFYFTTGVPAAWPVNASTLRLQTTTLGHAFSIDIYDNDDATWRPALTFTNGNTPTVSLGANVTLDGLGSVDLTTATDYKVGGAALIDDTKGNGDTGFVWSADKIYDELALKLNGTTQTKSFTINEPTASDDFLIWRTPAAITITAIHGVLLNGDGDADPQVIGGIDECDSNGANCVAVDSDITFNGSLDSDDGSLTNAAIDAGDWIMWHTTSVVNPGYLTVTIYFTQ